MTRKQDHVFQRPQSANFYVRLRDENGRRFIQSLGTNDKREAEVIALPLIAEHKARLLAARPRVEMMWQHKLEPGRKHIGEDGGEIIATEKELIYIGGNGAVIKTEPNGGFAKGLVFPAVPGAPFKLDLAEALSETPKRPTVATKNGDDDFLESYIKRAKLDGLREKQARDIWFLFKSVVNKPMKQCTRKDGEALVAALGEAKSATLRRRMVPLIATVNLAIKNCELTFNPFVGCVPNEDDSDRRLPFDDADMTLMRDGLHLLSESDQLLVRLLACSGMRRGEAFSIDREQTEGGCRFVIVGSKTEQSRRRVPFPAGVLRFLPKKITKPLFTGRMDTTGKRLRDWLIGIGITDPNKAPMHSFRHRAADRLRAADCPIDIRYELLGHEKKTVAAGYGVGSPVPKLKTWIDKIGF